MLQFSISRETMEGSKPRCVHSVFRRKNKASGPVLTEEQVEKNPLLGLGTPVKPRTTAKVYVRRNSVKVRSQCLSSPAFGTSSETKVSQVLSAVKATEEKDGSSGGKGSAYFDNADRLDVKGDVFVPSDTLNSSFKHHCADYEENKNVCTDKEADGMPTLACEEPHNVLDDSGSSCGFLGFTAVNDSVLESQDMGRSVLWLSVDSKEQINAHAHEKLSDKSIDGDSVFVVNESAELLNPFASAPKFYHSDTTSSSPVNNNPLEINRNSFFPGDHGFILMQGKPESAKAQSAKSPESSVTEDDHLRSKGATRGANGQDGAKGSKKAPRRKVKKKSHRPRIMVEGRKPRTAKVSKAKSATLGKQSVPRKRKREKDNEQKVVVAPETPEKQNLSKRRRKEKKSKHETTAPFSVDNGISLSKIVGQKSSVSANVVRPLKFDHESQAREENVVSPPFHLDVHQNPVSNEFGKTGGMAGSGMPSRIDFVGDPNVVLTRDSNEACDQVADETKLRNKVPRRGLGGQTYHAMETRRLSRRSKCLDASRRLRSNFPKQFKRKRMVRMSRIDFSELVFGIPSTIQEAIASNRKLKDKMSKTTMFPTWKKRSKRSIRLQNGSKWAAFSLFSRLPETTPALLGCRQRNCSQAMELPDITDHIQEIQTNKAKELCLLRNDGNQLHDTDIQMVHSLANPVTKNGKTEEKPLSFFGENGNEIIHRAQTIFDSMPTETSEMCKEAMALPLICGYQTDGSNQNLAAHGYPVNLEQQLSYQSLLSIQNYDLVQNVSQASCVGLKPYSFVDWVKSLEPEFLLCHEDNQFVHDDFWPTTTADSLEHEGSATKLTGELHQNQLPLTLNLFSGDVPMQNKRTSGALYQNQLQPMLNSFPEDVPTHFQATRQLYENFVMSASFVLPMPDMYLAQPGLPNIKAKDIELLVHKMKSLGINERMLNCNTMIKNNRKQGRNTQRSLDSKRQLMVLNHNAQGPNPLVPYEEPAKRKMKTAKVHLDPETVKEWQLLMMNCLPGGPNADEEREKKWEGEREVFRGRVDLFIKRMHLLQADRKFKQWKGSVVDSVVGVFLTQNVSDHLSSNAYISLAANFPPKTDHESSQESVGIGTGHSEALLNSEGQMYFIDEPLEENTSGLESSGGSSHVGTEGCKDVDIRLSEEINGVPILSCDDDLRISREALKECAESKNQRSTFDTSNNELKSSFESISLSETQCPLNMQETERSMPVEGQGGKTPGLEGQQKTTLRKNKKTGVMEDDKVDWKSVRRMYTKEGHRDRKQMDSVDWEAVRLSERGAVENSIKDRGQQTIIAGRIQDFLNQEVNKNGTIDLEWLRDAPPDLVKRYLLEINGLGLKSVECIRLLALKHIAFPVDTNVGRIAVRLGWVPLEPFPDEVQMHLLEQYPLMDSIQKYLWPRLCKLPQSVLYELHYQMITFGKVFCTKRSPNCNACPMKAECKHFASAYASAKLPLPHSQENKTENSEAFPALANPLVDTNLIPMITSIDENSSPECGSQTNFCEPIIEMPPSPSPEVPELIDIEDTPCKATQCHNDAEIPEIDMDMDAFKKNVRDAMLNIRKMLSSYSNEDVSKALVALTPEKACIPLPTPRLKYYKHLRTEHVVYVLPNEHELLKGFERREPDDPSPFLLTVWQPGETPFSSSPPTKKCNSDGSELCNYQTCSYCCSVREQNSNVLRGTILIPCRTAMRGSFPLNGTYFQINEVFADQETSLKPIMFPREWAHGLEKRALYCGSSVSAIFRGLDTRQIQLCFWTGFVCVRGFDRKQRMPHELARRLHTPPSKKGKKFERDDKE